MRSLGRRVERPEPRIVGAGQDPDGEGHGAGHYQLGRETEFLNVNASDDQYRTETVEKIRARLTAEPPGTLRVLLHSLAFGSLKPLAGAEQVVSRNQLEITLNTMGHSRVYWVQDCLRAGLFDWAPTSLR